MPRCKQQNKHNSMNTISRALAAAALLFCFQAAHAQQAPLQSTPANAGQLALCVACHGANGNSQIPTTPSLAGQPKVFIENQLVLIREGIRDVPQMKGLLDKFKDEDFVALGQYFSEQKLVKTATDAVNQASYLRGQETSKKMLCGTCHLPNYSGQNQIPRLAGQHEAFLKLSLKQFRDNPGTGRDSNMTAAAFGLKDGDIDDLSHFLANFK
jgi:cytochrome c553